MANRKKGSAAPEAATGTEEQEVELTVGQKMSATLRKHRVGYQATKAASGHASLDNGDAIAQILRGLQPDAVVALAENVLQGFEKGELAERYAKLNQGQRRMNAGNLIRNAAKRGELKVKDVEKALGK